MKYISVMCILSAVLCGISGGAGAQRSDYFIANGKKIDIRTFDGQFQQMMDEIGIPGASIAIIDKNKIVYYNAYGYKQLSTKSKVDKKTVFEACSLSKSYLVYVVYKLVEAGKLDLDKPLYQYTPYDELEYDPRFKLITARMVLSHSSGIENWSEDNDLGVLEIISNPGERFVYSSTAYNILALAIEKILNQPYDEYVDSMVIRPLGLEQSYLSFKKGNAFHKDPPDNYSIGHDAFGHDQSKWKNDRAIPSSMNVVTAEDYAKLLVAIFDGRHLSASSIKTILHPVVSPSGNDSSWYGGGFEVFYVGGDTIIAHTGINPGFRAHVLYSVTHKKGFVYMTNCDRGKVLTTHLNDMTVGMNIHKLYEPYSPEQYPSSATTLFRVYRERGSAGFAAAIDSFRKAGKLEENTLSELAFVFIEKDTPEARTLLDENVRLFPQASLTYQLLGDLYKNKHMFQQAYDYYAKAKALHFTMWAGDNAKDLKDCAAKIKDEERRKALLVKVGAGSGVRILAEDFNAMKGIEVFHTVDTGVTHTVGYVNIGDWMDYRVSVPQAGNYTVNFRVSSVPGGQFEFFSGSSSLTKVDIASTKGWRTFATVSAHVSLPAGDQTLRIYVTGGDFDINWLQLSAANESTASNSSLQ